MNSISLNINKDIICDPVKVANHFNNFFTSVAQKLAAKLKQDGTSFSDYLIDPNELSIFINPTCSDEIMQLLQSTTKFPLYQQQKHKLRRHML